MRIAVLILSLLGVAASGFVGAVWYSVNQEEKALMETATGKMAIQLAQAKGVNAEKIFETREFTVYGLGAACLLGLIGGIVAMMRKKWLAAPLLLMGTVAPLVYGFQLRALLPEGDKAFFLAAGAVSPLALGGLLSFFITPVARKKRVEDEEEDQEEEHFEDEAPSARPGRAPSPPKKGAAANFFEDDPPAPYKQPRKIEQEEPEDDISEQPPEEAAPPRPPVPAGPVVARFPCPKCGMSLKKTNPEAGKPIKCPKCSTSFPIPAKAVEMARRGASPG